MSDQRIQVGDVIPTQHGETVTVLFVGNNDKLLIEFNDKEKHQCFVDHEDLIDGNIENPYRRIYYDIGCIGEGRHKIKGNPSDRYESLEFTVWLDLLSGLALVTVNGSPFRAEWLNYQNFAEWYVNSDFYGFGYELDEYKQWSKK